MTPKPSPGDRLIQANGTTLYRVHRMTFASDGLPVGRMTIAGRARYEWRELKDIQHWDEYLLTQGEISALRYMRARAKEAA